MLRFLGFLYLFWQKAGLNLSPLRSAVHDHCKMGKGARREIKRKPQTSRELLKARKKVTRRKDQEAKKERRKRTLLERSSRCPQ